MGDIIVLLEGSNDFMQGLSTFPEKFLFNVSDAWKISIKGGTRKDQRVRQATDMADFSELFRSSVLVASANDTVEQARRNYTGDA